MIYGATAAEVVAAVVGSVVLVVALVWLLGGLPSGD